MGNYLSRSFQVHIMKHVHRVSLEYKECPHVCERTFGQDHSSFVLLLLFEIKKILVFVSKKEISLSLINFYIFDSLLSTFDPVLSLVLELLSFILDPCHNEASISFTPTELSFHLLTQSVMFDLIELLFEQLPLISIGHQVIDSLVDLCSCAFSELSDWVEVRVHHGRDDFVARRVLLKTVLEV